MIRARFTRWPLAALIVVIGAPAGLRGQDQECRPFLDGPRLPLPGPDPALRTGAEILTTGCGLGLGAGMGLVPATALVRYRSAWAYDHNDGALWTGRGLSTAVAGGLGFQRNHLRIVLDPTVAFQENRSFRLAGPDLKYPYGNANIDWPQQPRLGGFWTVSVGQSVIALSAGPAELALSTENLWWGPARRYPILVGNTAPGFANLRLGTNRAVDIGIGDLDVDLLWGRLDESAQFDTVSSNDHRLFTGFFFEFRPRIMPGLSLGVAGVQHNRWDESASRFLNLYTFSFNGELEHTKGNGLLSVEAHWRLVESDADFYVEWARDDYWADIQDLLTEPDHTQAYLFGFEKVVQGATLLRVSGELVHLESSSPTFLSRGGSGRNRFYLHGQTPQGHTNQGQLLGAAIGSGSDAQYLAIDRLGSARTLGFYLERIRRDEDTYYERFASKYSFLGHDLELTVGLTGEERRGGLRVQWEAAYSRRKNRSFIGMDGVNYPPSFRETNLSFSARTFWVPSPGR